MKENWIEKAIDHEATPEVLREITTQEFIKKYGVAQSTYYYHISKKENQEQILETSLKFAKRHTPKVLENLGIRAQKDNRATEIYLNYILQLAERLDITSGGEKLRDYDENQTKAIARRTLSDDTDESQEPSN